MRARAGVTLCNVTLELPGTHHVLVAAPDVRLEDVTLKVGVEGGGGC